MKTNPDVKLILRDLFSYDIGSCHYNILKNLGLNISTIDPKDKLGRNIKIGLMMKDNPQLVPILRNITESTINEYITRNGINENQIIWRAYDGIVTSKSFPDSDMYLPLELRGIFEVFISSFDRTKFLAKYQNGEISIKGQSERYEMIDEIFAKILKLNFNSKNAIFSGLQRIRDEIFLTKNPRIFCIPKEEGKFSVMLHGYGEVIIGESMIRMMGTEDIDRQWYWSYYFETYCKSIVVEFV